MKLFILSALLFVGISGEKVRFDNYQVYRLTPTDSTHVAALRDLELIEEYDFWTNTGVINGTADVLVPPTKTSEFLNFIDKYGINRIILIEDVQSLIDEQDDRVMSRCRDMEWNSYHKLNEIYSWMDDLCKKYPFVTKISAGKSYRGRQINGIEISFKENTTAVFIESGMHGREWITPAATSWMVNQILESSAKSVFRNFSYIYFPVFNPDGYAYTWSHNRLWKKTRTPYKVGSRICYGADPNKNWDFRWNEEGTSKNPCSENYAGPFPFSEIEMRSISSYLKCIARSRNIDVYIAYRSYSQNLLYPWDHQSSPAPQRDLWHRIGTAAVEDLKAVHGTTFSVGNSCQFHRPSSGVSREWYYNLFNSTINFVYEMRDKGGYGFLLPPDQIIPSGEELLPSLERILIEYQKLNLTNIS